MSAVHLRWKKRLQEKGAALFVVVQKKKPARRKKKVVTLKRNARRNSHIIEITLGNSRVINFLRAHRRSVSFGSIAVIIIGIVFVAASVQTRADILKTSLYPSSCLGSWQNATQAEGLPDIAQGGSGFTRDNSAYASAAGQEIFCGNWKGDTPPEATPKKFTLKLSWLVTANSVAPSSKTTTPAAPDEAAPASDALPASDAAPTEGTLTPESEQTDQTPAPAVAPEAPPEPQSFLQKLFLLQLCKPKIFRLIRRLISQKW